MIRVQIDKNNAWVTQREKITMYSEGYDAVQIELSLSDEWDGLSKIGVFRAGDVQIDMPVTTSSVTIPVNAILVPNVHLFFGLYGLTTANGRVAIPTTWADLGIIQPAADPTAASNYNQPVPGLYDQIATMVEAAEAAAIAATTGTYAGTATFAIETTPGEHFGYLKMTIDGSDPTYLGLATAYGEAVAAGYEGSEEEFQDLLIANYGSASTIAALQTAVQAATNTANSAYDEAVLAGQSADAAQTAATAAQNAVASKQTKYTPGVASLTSGGTQWTENVAGVTASNLVLWDYDGDDSFTIGVACKVRMIAQGAGTVTFKADTATTGDVDIKFAIFS